MVVDQVLASAQTRTTSLARTLTSQTKDPSSPALPIANHIFKALQFSSDCILYSKAASNNSFNPSSIQRGAARHSRLPVKLHFSKNTPQRALLFTVLACPRVNPYPSTRPLRVNARLYHCIIQPKVESIRRFFYPFLPHLLPFFLLHLTPNFAHSSSFILSSTINILRRPLHQHHLSIPVLLQPQARHDYSYNHGLASPLAICFSGRS